jgi:two-component system, OmpR family, response regulator
MSKGSILVVEPKVEICRILSNRLSVEGYRLWLAHDCAEAEQRCLLAVPDVIILETSLANADEFAKRWASDGKGKPRFIFFTRERLTESFMPEMDVYLNKPFDPEELVLHVRDLMRRANPNPSP